MVISIYIDVGPHFRSFNKQFESFSCLQKAKQFALPAPSEFAKNWRQYESAFRDRLLCFRPPDSHGLPLCTLHDTFRWYLIVRISDTPFWNVTVCHRRPGIDNTMMLIDGTILSTKADDATVAQQSQDYKENTRVLKFDDCVRGTLGGFDTVFLLRPS